jgi:EmrB/QacA subfamily drug resistance transporter
MTKTNTSENHLTKRQALLREAVKENISPVDLKRRWLILITLCGSLLVVMLANSALNLALPSIAVSMNATSGDLNWIVETYSLLFAGLLFTAGAVGDRYGRKIIMQIGLLIFLVASLYAAFVAGNSTELIIMRGLMGVGGAMVMPTTLSILNVTFPSSQRTKAVAIWGAVAGAGVIVGSIVSGFLLEHFEWESVFIFAAIVAAIVLITNQLLTRESKDPEETKVDWLGGLLSTVGLGALVFGLMESSHAEGWANPIVWVALAASVVFLTGFVFWQRHTDHPMLDMELFKSRRFTVAVIAITLAFFAINGILFVMSQVFQLILGYTPLEGALAMLPIIAVLAIFAPIAPNMMKWVGEKKTLLLGVIMLGAGFFTATLWPTEVGYWNIWLTMVLVLGGMQFSSTPATNMILDSVPKNRSGMAAAMNDTTRELGGALGIAILGSIMVSSYNEDVQNKLNTITNLPAAARSSLEDSLAVALRAIQTLAEKGLDLTDLVPTFKEYWLNGLNDAMSVALWACVATAFIVIFGLKGKKRKRDIVIVEEESQKN